LGLNGFYENKNMQNILIRIQAILLKINGRIDKMIDMIYHKRALGSKKPFRN
jgi:hypothetical protein